MSNQTLPSPASASKRRATSSTAAASASGKSSAKQTPSNNGNGAKNQTARSKTPATKANGSAAKYRVRQTARVEGLRDGKPLIFGWGRHLTRVQKARYQRVALVSFAGAVILAILGVLVYGVLNETIFIPNSAVVTVNGVKITQETYRKNLAVEAQQLWNTLQSEVQQDTALQPKVATGDATAANQQAVLESQIQSNEGKYSESTVTGTAITDLMNDQLIIAGAKQLEAEKHLPASTFDPTSKEINDALAAFKKAFPKNETYASFLKANSMTDSDVRATLAMQLRATKMQTYLAAQYVSPTRQVHIREIQTDTAANAAAARKALVDGKLTDDTWKTVANKDSVDPNAKSTGGDLGFVAPGSGDAAIELWAYASDRKVDDLSPVITDASGTFDVVQVLAINPSLAVDSATLQSIKDNALPHWLSMQTSQLGKKVGTPNTTMLTLARNLPKAPDLNGALPTFTAPAGSLPSGAASGLGG
jgi:hypothetical protein